jgi:hypothetical protein
MLIRQPPVVESVQENFATERGPSPCVPANFQNNKQMIPPYEKR